MPIVSKYIPLVHYKWGDGCDGWTLVEEEGISIKQERMPPGTSEDKHYHQKSRQFFFILQGKASFEIERLNFELKEGEGIWIEAGNRHRIMNQSTEELEFILCSQPSTLGDRVNL